MIPDAITGDFDSARPDVLEHYRAQGCRVVPEPSQNLNDLEKAVNMVLARPREEDARPLACVAYGAFGDRFDHELSAIGVLYRHSHMFEGPLLLAGERMTARLLASGRHVIAPDPVLEGPTCGLLPIGGRCERVSSSGLRWNLDAQALEFGGLVSSSNQLLPRDSGGSSSPDEDLEAHTGGWEDVCVETTQPLVWTTTVRPRGGSSESPLPI